MPLSDRQKRYLLAAFRTNNGGTFDTIVAGKGAGFSDEESNDLSSSLYHDGIIEEITYGNSAWFSAQGREAARELIEKEEYERVRRTGVSKIKRKEPSQKP